MGIYDRDWWRERYNQRTSHNESRDAQWQQPTTKRPPKEPPEGEQPYTPTQRPKRQGMKPSPVGAIIVWLAIFLAIFVSVKHIMH